MNPPYNKNWNQEHGKMGEAMARRFLEKKGFKILISRYRTRVGEIDLIALKKTTLYFVEVKTRSDKDFGDPLEAITPLKIARLERAAIIFLEENPDYRSNFHIELLAIAVRCYGEESEIECVNLFPG